MSQNLQKFVKFQKFQLENLVDFEKCCKTHIYLQKSVPIQPKTSNILPKFCQKLATTLRVHYPPPAPITRPTFSRGNVRGRRFARGTRLFALTRATPKMRTTRKTVHDRLPSLWTSRCRRFKIRQNWFRTELRFRNISITRC